MITALKSLGIDYFTLKNYLSKIYICIFIICIIYWRNTAQQKCYCGAPKCRGFISKKSKTGYFSSSSDESDDEEDISVIKPDEQEKRKKIKIKKITNKDKKRLQEVRVYFKIQKHFMNNF